MKTKTDVLIVGAGPTGLALATALQQRGVDYLIVDALGEAQNSSRAAVVHAHTLEMLERLGVVPELERRGMALPDFVVRDRDAALLSLSFSDLPSEYRHLLMVPQTTTEDVLQQRLTQLSGTLHRNTKAMSAEATGDGARVTFETPDGTETVDARYVVGADGMHSLVREAAGIGFAGSAYDESFVLADVQMDWPLGSSEVSLFFSPAGLVVVAPLPDGSFRIVATLDDAPDKPTVSDVQAILDARGPSLGCRVTAIGWASRFRVHHRLADTYRAGPFLLMGDAAHVHSPAGGQGMNTGLVDAVVLGEALARVVRHGETEALLDDYAKMRRPAAAAVLKLASRLTGLAVMRSGLGRAARNHVLALLNRSAFVKRKLVLGLSGIARRKFSMLSAAVVDTRNKQAPTSTAGLTRQTGRAL